MSHQPEVVVIDGLRETAEVLQAVFERKGVSVSSRRSHAHNLEPAVASPQIHVLHKRTGAQWDPPRIIVGRGDLPSSTTRLLSEPFQYADLIAAIDELVDLSST